MIVLDCSAAVHIAQRTLEGNALRSLIVTTDVIISSELLFIESASTYAKYVRSGAFDENTAQKYLQATVSLVERFVPIQENYLEAFHESLRLNHSVYDMLYLTLARRNAATLATFDAKLRALCEQQGVDCIHLIDYS
ncbi:MAG: type II toxin-antitoxin system VapC family toxin [Coriobacteriia bacterium]|nr:type II toxin-antitoxin system VapC family toxin [Coriobacteriia bacterium]